MRYTNNQQVVLCAFEDSSDPVRITAFMVAILTRPQYWKQSHASDITSTISSTDTNNMLGAVSFKVRS